MGKAAAVVVAGVAIVCAAAACAAAAVVVSSRMRVRSQRRHARNVLQEFQEACSTPLPRLRQVVDAMAVEMHAGLVSEGGSRLKMLPTFVDRLPHGYVCMHGGSKTLQRNQTRSKLASFFFFFPSLCNVKFPIHVCVCNAVIQELGPKLSSGIDQSLLPISGFCLACAMPSKSLPGSLLGKLQRAIFYLFSFWITPVFL
jgi:hypothetical protein